MKNLLIQNCISNDVGRNLLAVIFTTLIGYMLIISIPHTFGGHRIQITHRIHLNHQHDNVTNLPTIYVAPLEQEGPSITGSRYEDILRETAITAGIEGTELIAFMSQMAHESGDFRWLTEVRPNLKRYASGKTAESLGNHNMTDAKRFIGRGFIQLTGRWNYNWMEKELGIDLTSSDEHAQMAADPVIAAKIAIIYWEKRVQPRVEDFSDVHEVTKPINSRLVGIEERIDKFVEFAIAFNAHDDVEHYL